MNYSNDIKFSNNLIKNGETYISYSGNLYKQNSSSVHIVYGFGDNWEHTIEKEMEKNANGFVAKIKILNYDKFNFCFKNQYNEWDNNNNSNYIAPIVDDNDFEDNFIINEGLLDDLINNTFKNNKGAVQSTSTTPVDTLNIENVIDNDTSINKQISEIFSDINTNDDSNIVSNTISDNYTNNNSDGTDTNEDIEDIQITDINVSSPLEIQINDNTDFDDNLIQTNTINEIENVNIETISEETELNENNVEANIQEIELNEEQSEAIVQNTNSSTDIFDTEENIENNNEETIETKNDDSNEFDMNSLIEEILSPIVTSEDFIEEDLESYKKASNDNFTNNLDNDDYIEEDKKVDEVITNYLNDLYENINTSDNSLNINESVDTNNNYSELDKTISKFKQIQALQDLDSFFDNNISSNSSEENNIEVSNEENNIGVSNIEINNTETNQNEINQDEVNQEFDETDEQSLIEDVINDNFSNIETANQSFDNNEDTENALIVSPRHLSSLYIIKKKLKLSFLKIFGFIPKLLNQKTNKQSQ